MLNMRTLMSAAMAGIAITLPAAAQSQSSLSASAGPSYGIGSGKRKRNPRKCPPQPRIKGGKYRPDVLAAMHERGIPVKNVKQAVQLEAMHQDWLKKKIARLEASMPVSA